MDVAQVNFIHDLGEKIGTRLARAEELGAEGNVDESLRLMTEVEELKREKQNIEVTLRVETVALLLTCWGKYISNDLNISGMTNFRSCYILSKYVCYSYYLHIVRIRFFSGGACIISSISV